MDMPKNVFVSWASTSGNVTADGTFVEEWTAQIAAKKFMQHPIGTVANKVKTRAKCGKTYDGLDAERGECIGGAWVKLSNLDPSDILVIPPQERVKERLKDAKIAKIISDGKPF